MQLQRANLNGIHHRLLGRWRDLPDTPSGLIVGFSGGADSLALAATLGHLRSFLGVTPRLVHVDHGWRPESRVEQEAAQQLADKLGLPFTGIRLDPARLTRHSGVGREEAARRERLLALAEIADDAGTDLVALAHHAQDQAESVLLHLLRGSGTHGLAGMAELSSIPLPYWTSAPVTTLRLWRPFLQESRTSVRKYAATTGLSPVPDPSNHDLAYRRNQVRATVLPALADIEPSAIGAIARGAMLAADDDALLTELARTELAGAINAEHELDRAAILAQRRPIQRRMVRLWLAEAAPWFSMTAERTDAMLRCLTESEPGRALELGDGLRLVRTRSGIRLVQPGIQCAGNARLADESR